MLEHEGRQEAVIKGLKAGQVDIMTFQEPTTSALQATGLVTTLFDLNSRESTAKVLGSPWPAQSLLMAPAFIKAHPETVQKLVNAFVRTMRYIARTPPTRSSRNCRPTISTARTAPPRSTTSSGRCRAWRKTIIRFRRTRCSSWSTRSRRLALTRARKANGGARPRIPSVDPAQLYTNEFVQRAMAQFPRPKKSAEPANAGVSIWTQNVTAFRKEHGSVGGYTKRWDLSDLPHYVPKQQLTGTLRIWGNNYIKDGYLGGILGKGVQEIPARPQD